MHLLWACKELSYIHATQLSINMPTQAQSKRRLAQLPSSQAALAGKSRNLAGLHCASHAHKHTDVDSFIKRVSSAAAPWSWHRVGNPNNSKPRNPGVQPDNRKRKARQC